MNKDIKELLTHKPNQQELKQFFDQLDFSKSQTQIKDLIINKAQVPNTKFQAVKAQITIKAPLLKVVAKDQELKNFENQNGWKVYKFIFENDEDKQKLINFEQNPQNLTFLVHTIKDVKMITDREVVCVRDIVYDNTNQTVTVYNQSIPQVQFFKSSIPSINKTIKIYAQHDSSVHITQYQYVDPQGSIPAAIYNPMLTKMVEQLQVLKDQVECH